MSEERKLSPEDQARVDHFLRTGYNDVERKPFRPFRLMFILALVVTGFSIFSLLLARLYGIY